MNRSPKSLARILSAFVFFTASALIPFHDASAVNIAVPRAGSGVRTTVGAAGAAVRISPALRGGSFTGQSFSGSLKPSLKPTALSIQSLPHGEISAIGVIDHTAANVETIAVPSAFLPSEEQTQTVGIKEAIESAGRTDMAVLQSAAQGDQADVSRLPRIFDGMNRKKSLTDSDEAGLVSAGDTLGSVPSGLSKSDRLNNNGAEPASPQTPIKSQPSRGFQRAAIALAVAVLALAVPAVAMAAAVPAAVGASLPFISMIHPAATAFAATAGAVYGLVSAQKRGGPAPSAGEILSSVLRYGMLGGAGIYVLLDLTQVLFLGISAVGLSPLPTSVATAALGQSAFQGKFSESSTTPADRLMTTFPAIAAALGLSLGIFLTGAALPAMLAVGAMSITGVAAAVYGALYEPGKSAGAGPSQMARGFVLQSLMTGMSLAVANPLIAAPFALLAAWGFWNVISTAASEGLRRLKP